MIHIYIYPVHIHSILTVPTHILYHCVLDYHNNQYVMLLLLHMYLVMRIPPVTGTVLVFPGGVVTVPEGVGDPVLTSSVEVVGITVVTAVVRSISHCNGLLCMV